MKTIFFNEYPKKEIDLNKKNMIMNYISSILFIMIGFFLWVFNGIWWFSTLLLIIILIASWDFWVHGIKDREYMKDPSKFRIYDKKGKRIDDYYCKHLKKDKRLKQYEVEILGGNNIILCQKCARIDTYFNLNLNFMMIISLVAISFWALILGVAPWLLSFVMLSIVVYVFIFNHNETEEEYMKWSKTGHKLYQKK